MLHEHMDSYDIDLNESSKLVKRWNGDGASCRAMNRPWRILSTRMDGGKKGVPWKFPNSAFEKES